MTAVVETVAAQDAERLSPLKGGAAARIGALLLAAALLLCAALLSLAVGSRALPTADVVGVLLQDDGSETAAIVRQLRLPRTLVAIVMGAVLGVAVLGVAGAQFQALTRNPLADPGLLGVSAGAAVAVVSTSTVLGAGGATGQAWAALLGASAAAVTVYVRTLRRESAAAAAGRRRHDRALVQPHHGAGAARRRDARRVPVLAGRFGGRPRPRAARPRPAVPARRACRR